MGRGDDAVTHEAAGYVVLAIEDRRETSQISPKQNKKKQQTVSGSPHRQRSLSIISSSRSRPDRNHEPSSQKTLRAASGACGRFGRVPRRSRTETRRWSARARFGRGDMSDPVPSGIPAVAVSAPANSDDATKANIAAKPGPDPAMPAVFDRIDKPEIPGTCLSLRTLEGTSPRATYGTPARVGTPVQRAARREQGHVFLPASFEFSLCP